MTMNNNKTSDLFLSLQQPCGEPIPVECYVAKWIWILLLPLLLALGTFGNVLSLVVLARKNLRVHSTSIILMFLAVSDLTALWSAILRKGPLHISGVDIRNWSQVICMVQPWCVNTASLFSVFMLVLLTAERTLLTMFPVYSRGRITRKRTLISCVVMLILVIVITGRLLFINTIKSDKRLTTNGTFTILNNTSIFANTSNMCLPRTVDSEEFMAGLWKAQLFIINLTTSMFIIAGNTAVAVKLILQKKKRKRPEGHTPTAMERRMESAAKLLLVVCCFYLICTIPYTSFAVITNLFFTDLQDAKMYARLHLMYAVTTTLLLCNNTFNFWLYFVSGTLFKREWQLIVASVKNRSTTLIEWIRQD